MTVVEHHTAAELAALHRGATCPRLAKRLWVIWQACLGRTEPEITAWAGMSRRTVQGWVRRYNRDGLEGLHERPGRGRKPHLTAAERQQVAAQVEAVPGPDEPCAWRGVDYQRFIQQQLGKRLSLSAVYNLLHQLGYSWLVPRPRHRQADPAAQEAFKKNSPPCSRRSSNSIPTKR